MKDPSLRWVIFRIVLPTTFFIVKKMTWVKARYITPHQPRALHKSWLSKCDAILFIAKYKRQANVPEYFKQSN